jgi:transcription antitermination factor NusG
MNSAEMAWFALAVIPRKEKVTAQTLRAKGYEDFLPQYTVRRRWSDRVKEVVEPLFPGYVFCRFDPAVRLPILKIPTVMSVLGIGGHPEPVAEAEIAALQAVCKTGVEAVPCPYLTVGAAVRLHGGPLTGVEGILAGSVDAKDARLVLSITLLQRSVAVEVDREWIEPVRIYRAL